MNCIVAEVARNCAAELGRRVGTYSLHCLHLGGIFVAFTCLQVQTVVGLLLGGGAHFTDIFALGLWLLESAKESDRLPQTSLAFLDFSATGEWHPARPVAVVGASALHPEVAWSSHCCWSAVGGRVAAGGQGGMGVLGAKGS